MRFTQRWLIGREARDTHAQTCDPVSGITVKRAVSSSSRTQAIFSSVFRAAISLLKVRMFFSSVLNLILGQVSAEGPFGRVQTRQKFPPVTQLMGAVNDSRLTRKKGSSGELKHHK